MAGEIFNRKGDIPFTGFAFFPPAGLLPPRLIHLLFAGAIYILKLLCSILHSCRVSTNGTQCQPIEAADGGIGYQS